MQNFFKTNFVYNTQENKLFFIASTHLAAFFVKKRIKCVLPLFLYLLFIFLFNLALVEFTWKNVYDTRQQQTQELLNPVGEFKF